MFKPLIVDKSKVVVLSDLWFVGDKFVNDNYHTMSAMTTVAKMNKADPLYVFDYYNVKCFTSNPLSHVCLLLARLVNNVIKALNNKECVLLPRFIVIIPDWDILKFLDYNTYGVETVVTAVVKWAINEMGKAIEAKKDELFKIKPRSVIGSEPKIVWVKMLQRVDTGEKVLTVRGKYNIVLEKLLAERNGHYIVDINPILKGREYFTQDNELLKMVK